MFLRVEAGLRWLNKHVQATVAAPKSTAAEEIVDQDVIKLHTLALQDCKNKSDFANLSLKFIFGRIVSNKDNLFGTETSDVVIELF